MSTVSDSSHDTFPLFIEVLSIVLLGIFLVTIFSKLLPLHFFTPTWQLTIIGDIVNNGSLALIGVFFTHLSLYFNPANERLRLRRNAFRRWALAVSIGFLLLIPLQASAAWRLYSGFTSRAEQQATQSARKTTQLRQAITNSSTTQELQSNLQKLLGTNFLLAPQQLSLPLTELKSTLLISAEQVSNRVQQAIEAQSAVKPDRIIQESIRVALTSLLYAIGFAYFAGILPRNGKRRVH